jgi:predicted small lipoprotein YifL
MKRLVSLFTLILSLFSLVGCVGVGPTLPPVNDSIQAIDEAISALDVNSGEWQRILTDLMNRVSGALKNDVSVIIDRAVSSTAEQANCLVDIRIRQIKQALEALRARFLGGTAPVIEPYICLVTPTAVQMSLLQADPHYSRKVDLSGYDMDKGDIRVKIEKNNTTFVTLPRNTFSRQTHYHAVFDYSGVNISTDDKRFVFFNGNRRLAEVPILHKQCEIVPKEQAIQTFTIDNFQKTAGDADFGWNKALVDVGISLSIDGNRVKALIEVKADEDGGDTRSKQNRTVTVFINTDPRFTINRILSARTFSKKNFHNTTDTPQNAEFGGAGMVKKITYSVKQLGFDDLNTSNIKIELNKIVVELKEKGVCVE